MKNVSAVIPNYNGRDLLKKFLPDVIKCLDNKDELIVVDDNSTDDSVKFLMRNYKLKLNKKTVLSTKVSTQYFPQPKSLKYKLYSNLIKIGTKKVINFHLVVLEKNMRFAAAANTGVLFADNNYIFLLNNDVKPTKNVRNQLMTHFSDPLVFGVGCLEYEKNKFGEQSGKNKLVFSQGIFVHSKADDMLSGKSAWISGGSGMFDKNKWVFLNGFDQLFYPAYWEDIDLSYRARKIGWKVLFDQEAVVFHVHESTNIDVFGSQKIDIMSWSSLTKFLKKHANFWQLIQYYIYKPLWSYRRNKVIKNNKAII